MAPYKVALLPPKGDRLDLVVPFDSSKPFSDLTAAVLQRASKHRSLPSSVRHDCLKLCLGSDNGFLIDPDDIVKEVMANSSDILFIIFLDGPGQDSHLSDEDLSSVTGALQIRVITPKLAQRTSETRQIALLRAGRHYRSSTSLKEIRQDVAQHLHLELDPLEEPAPSECNCKLAQLLVKRGEWETFACDGHSRMGCFFTSANISPSALCARCSNPVCSHDNGAKAADCQSYILRRTDLPCRHVIHSQCLALGGEYDCPSSCYMTKPAQNLPTGHFLVVFGNGHVEKLELSTKNHSALMSRLADHFGHNFTDTKTVFCKGGIEDDGIYSRLPVVAVCASDRHRSGGVASTDHGPSRTMLDLHTVEGPINTHNLNVTLKDAKLAEIAVNGVLTLYAVGRRFDGDLKKGKGKDAMFSAASHWRLPSLQSDRGMAAFLASLRVFAYIIGSEEFDDYRQNEVLRIVHSLTRFPPTVRAAHILMDGKTLKPNESAAVVQSISAVAEELIPLSLVSNDARRSLEGARLVLGLILHSIRNPETSQTAVPDTMGASLPYVAGYQTVDLRDAKTSETVIEPFLCNLGLVNKRVFDLLQHSPSSYLSDCSQDDPARLRVALLYGGVAPEAPYYEADMLGGALEKYATLQSHSLDLKGLSCDISFLASLCEETKLVVVAPRHLSNGKAPSLTLDRHGNMAVYTGRAACAGPGQEHTVFLPLTGVEVNVDVTIVSQMLEPILKAREKDGTNVFDLFSATFRHNESLPTELIVFCVDCSHSMNEPSGFSELIEDNDLPGSDDEDEDILLDDEDETDVPLEEVKSWLRDHESYEDILSIIHNYPDEPQEIADEILGFVRTCITRELAHLASKQRTISQWATSTYSRTSSTLRRMDALRKTLFGLNLHEEALLDFLVFIAKNPSFTSKDVWWSYGDDLPSTCAASAPQDTKDLADFCIIPQEYLCPISQVIFEDPVSTVDGFTFDRKAIERWYRIRNSSPLTGLPVEDTSLRHHQSLAGQIKAWVKAEDVIESLPSSPKRTRLGTRHSRTVIDFVAPTVRFTQELSGSATLLDLHKVAFRGMRGLYIEFSLHMGGIHLPCTEENIASKGVAGNQTITVSPNPHNGSSRNPSVQNQMCLVRVYADGDRAEEVFNYWVPLHSELTFGSVIFRNWRYQIEQTGESECYYDKSPWTGLKDGGDGVAIGTRNDPWSSLSTSIRNLPRVRILEHEVLYARLRDIGSQTNVSSRSTNDTTLYDRCRVLKVELNGYESREDIERREARKKNLLSRMGVTKQVFSQFINRLIAYNYPTNVGLVTFGTQARISQKITDVIENFRQAVDRMNEEGDTALFDALALAADHLKDIGQTYPNIKKRMICLSDGKDTSSLRGAEDVCRTLMQDKIVVDSVCIGDEYNGALRAISYLTGGYKFVPKSVEAASALCELEPVLSIHERPPVSPPVANLAVEFSRVLSSARAVPDPVTRDAFPARKTHENLCDSFIQVGQFERARPSTLSEQPGAAGSSIRSRRLLQELGDMASHPHPSYDVFVSERNMGFWKVVLEGPNGSAYASGTFVLYLDMGEDYPRKAPGGRFVTPMFHPNVNKHGRIW